MQHIHDSQTAASRLIRLIDDLSVGCDSDFDTAYEDLDREFAELRLHLGND
jgi:signal transduction histidine kinase